MELFINNKSGAPIYDQIYNQIKQQIISGALQPDEAMPSIRGLARDLRISVNVSGQIASVIAGGLILTLMA